MRKKHLWWIIPLCLIVGGLVALKLLSGLLNYTGMEMSRLCMIELGKYKNISTESIQNITFIK